MMGKNIVAFAIVAYFIVSEIVEESASETITLDQLVGEWYAMGGTAWDPTRSDIYKCLRMNITKEKLGRQHNFKIENTYTMNGVSKQMDGYGIIVNDKVSFLFPYSSGKNGFTVEQKYDNGRELLLKTDQINPYYIIWSRSTSISNETELKLKQLATETDKEVYYMDHSECSYDDSII